MSGVFRTNLRWTSRLRFGASVATVEINSSSITAEPNVKFKGNRHMTRVKSQFNCSRARDGKPDGQGREACGNY